MNKRNLLYSIIVLASSTAFSQIEQAGPFCSGLPPQQLIAEPDSGNWGGAADNSGFFYPTLGATNSPYIVTYTYIDTSGTVITDVSFIEVIQSPDVAIDPAGPFCAGDGIQQLIATPPGGFFSSLSGAVDDNGLFNPFAGASGSPYIISYVFVDTSNGCPGFDTLDIIVNDLPEVTIDPVLNLCPYDSLVQMVVSPAGGTWIGSIDSLGFFDPGVGFGFYPVLYTFMDSITGCTNSALEVINVLDTVDPILFGIGPFCQEDTLQAVFAFPSSGVFGGAVDSIGYFDPAIGPGEHLVTYIYECPNCCPMTDSIYIGVHEPESIILSGNGPYCDLGTTDTLRAMPLPGIWSGDVDSLGVFQPTTIGNYVAIFSIVDTNGCLNNDTLELLVIPTPYIQITPAGPFCFGDTMQQLFAQPDSGWFNWIGAVDSLGVFDPAIGDGDFEVIYNYQDSGSCAFSDTVIISVNPLPDVLINPAGPFCDNDTAIQLFAIPSGGTWFGDVDINGWFEPSIGQVGSPYNVIYDVIDQNNCSNADTLEIIVFDAVAVEIDSAGPFCINHVIQQLSASPPGGIWGGAANVDGTFDPGQGAGLYTVTYFFNDGTCEILEESQILVDLCDGIGETTLPNVLLVPNPSTGIFDVVLEGKVRDEVELRVIDLAGRLVLQYDLTRGATRISLDLQSYPTGTYLLELSLNNSRSYHPMLLIPQ